MSLREKSHCNGILCTMSWKENKGVTWSELTHHMLRVQVSSSIIQHAQNHENLTRDICNTDDKIWTNSKGHVTFLKFQYLQALRVCLNELQNILCRGLPGRQTNAPESYYYTGPGEQQPPARIVKILPSSPNPLFRMNFYYSNAF